MTLRDRAAMLSGHASGEQISAFVDGQVSPGEHEWLTQHLDHCPRCATAVARETWLKARVSGLNTAMSVPDRFTALSHLEACRSGRVGGRRTSLALAGAGVLGVAVLGLGGYTAARIDPAEVPGVSASLVTEVSQTLGETLDMASSLLRGSAD